MFGFGMSAKDKWHLEQVEIMMSPYAMLSGQKEAKKLAREMFDSVKARLVTKYGDSIYSENFGDKLIATEKSGVEKRLNAGLTMEDIRNYWNLSRLYRELQISILNMPWQIELGKLIEMGKSQDEIDNIMQDIVYGWRKSKPCWGEPEEYNPDLPKYKGYSMKDADLYIEFFDRVGYWQLKTSNVEQQALLNDYSSYNSMLRDLISKGII